jgi:hypothetical protein
MRHQGPRHVGMAHRRAAAQQEVGDRFLAEQELVPEGTQEASAALLHQRQDHQAIETEQGVVADEQAGTVRQALRVVEAGAAPQVCQ